MWHLEPYDEIRTAVNHVSPIAVGASTWVPIYCELNNKNECGSLHVTGMLKQCVSALMFCTQCHVRIRTNEHFAFCLHLFKNISHTSTNANNHCASCAKRSPRAPKGIFCFNLFWCACADPSMTMCVGNEYVSSQTPMT